MRFVLAATMLMAMAGVVSAAPTGAQLEEFEGICLKNSGGNAELCTCKAEQATKLVDEPFMGVIIASMKGGALDPQYAVRYNRYIMQSNAVCIPGY